MMRKKDVQKTIVFLTNYRKKLFVARNICQPVYIPMSMIHLLQHKFALISDSSRTFNFFSSETTPFLQNLNNDIPLSKPDYLLHYSKPYNNIKSDCNKLIFLI